MYRNIIKWYEDSFKIAEGDGMGINGLRSKYFESLGKYLSIFQKEIHAIKKCVQFDIDGKWEVVKKFGNQTVIKAFVFWI